MTTSLREEKSMLKCKFYQTEADGEAWQHRSFACLAYRVPSTRQALALAQKQQAQGQSCLVARVKHDSAICRDGFLDLSECSE